MHAKTHTHDPGLDRAVEKQLRRWEIASGQHSSPPCGGRSAVFDFIALSNLVGAGGGEIAEGLAHRLGWPIFDRQLLTAMADNDEVRAQLYRSMDERDLGWFEESFRALMQQEFRKNDYFHRLSETVLCLARRGPVILLGRGADLILPRDRGLRVKVMASRQRRVESFARRMDTTMSLAEAEIDRIEHERRDFFLKHFRADAEDPARFDLLINVERFTPEQSVEIILGALRMRCPAKAPAG